MLLVGCESMALHRANSKPSQPIVPESIKNHASDPPWMAFQEKESPDKRRICNDFPTLEVASQVFTDSDSASPKQATEVTCTPQTNASKVQPSHHQNTNLVVPARPEQPNPALQIIPEDSLFSKVHSIPTGKLLLLSQLTKAIRNFWNQINSESIHTPPFCLFHPKFRPKAKTQKAQLAWLYSKPRKTHQPHSHLFRKKLPGQHSH